MSCSKCGCVWKKKRVKNSIYEGQKLARRNAELTSPSDPTDNDSNKIPEETKHYACTT